MKLAYIARTGQSVRIDRLGDDAGWIRDPEWARREGLAAFAGRPLLFRGDVLGGSFPINHAADFGTRPNLIGSRQRDRLRAASQQR